MVAQTQQRLGIDIGGTFTDLVMIDEVSGMLRTMKVPSQPSNPAMALEDGIRQLIAMHGIPPEAISYFVHGTTIALNTLIQRAGARTGLLITRGFGDVLEIGRLRLPNPNDFQCERAAPLVPRHLVREIDERLLASGDELEPLDEAQLRQAAAALVDRGVEALAISFLHAYRNDFHERQAAAVLRETYPHLYIATSSETWPEQREYERTLATVINSYLGGEMRTYFAGLEAVAADLGLRTTLFTTKSNGGLMTARSAHQSPIETLLSGPASGVVGALATAQSAGFDRAISLDMGGTSADIAIIDGAIPYSTDGHVGDFPVIMPTIEISSIGAGGGSIAWTDASGLLKVGPRSAGAQPGPVCYGRGGVEPTVTDAYVTLNIIDPARFLGGRMPLDAAAAHGAMAALGERIGGDAFEAAASVLAVVTANMYAQLLPLIARKGGDPRDFALVAYGGAGPTQACLLAADLGISRVIVPRYPGLLCAYGSLVADLKSDFVATLIMRADQISTGALEARFRELETQGREWLAAQTGQHVPHAIIRTADMRYRGQSFEINVELSGNRRQVRTMDEVLAAFHEDYELIYSQSDVHAPAEIVNIRVTVSGESMKPSPAPIDEAPSGAAPIPIGRRRISLDGIWVDADIYDRAALLAGHRFAGPAVVEQADTTTLLPSGMTATVDWLGTIIIEVTA